MYAYIRGILTEKNIDTVVIECGGIGYCIFATDAFVRDAEIGQVVKIYVWQCVREDGISLFGFIDDAEKNMFLRLISVSGVGPKSALQMLSAMGTQAVAAAIVTGDTKALTKVPGIGTKTAQRIVIDLRGSIENEELVSGGAVPQKKADNQLLDDAVEALTSMGIPHSEAVRRVSQVADAGSVEDILRAALKNMNGAG